MTFKKFWFLPQLFLLIGISLAILFGALLFSVTLPSFNFTPRMIIVEKGMTLHQVAYNLQKEGLINNTFLFSLLAKVIGLERNIKAGRYSFSKPPSILQIIWSLKRGGALAINLTIPEGLRATEIAILLEKKLSIDKEEFLKLIEDTSLCRKYNIQAENLEGYLFPDTYNFYWEMEPREVIELMLKRFREIFNQSWEVRSRELGYSILEILTLSSIIEKEAKLDIERPYISAVFHNRLKYNRPLESCATVEYALPERKERLSLNDLNISSSYNTYIHLGLPPGPICNPGRKSIEAALYPAKVDYLYFVSKGDGSHIFSRTSSEHLKAKHSLDKKGG